MDTKHNIAKEHGAVISIRLTRAQHMALKQLAAHEQRTISQQVRHLVEVAVNRDRSAA